VVERLARGGDRAVHVRGRRLGYAADHLFGVRRDDVDGAGAGGRDPLTADEELFVLQHCRTSGGGRE
jgi:hypothetical protein